MKPDGLEIAAGKAATIHFDNGVATPSYYHGKVNDLYGTSANGLIFDVTPHTANDAPPDFTVRNAAGAAKVADQRLGLPQRTG